MKTKKLIVFGTGDIAQLANYYFDIDSDYNVVAFTADKEYCNESTFENKPLIPFEEIVQQYSPLVHEIFIAISYAQMNKLRAQKYNEAKAKNYKFASYISSKCTYLSQYTPGENAFILEDNTIQPFAKIGNNVILWSGNHIGHHSIIEDHCFISSHVVVSGGVKIEEYCFVGINSTIRDHVNIAKESVIGAGSIIMKDTLEKEVYIPDRTEPSILKSNHLRNI
jgi:sugar O-acyltransferase (sialic acid O-acetyltransferase NeuD family)